MTTIALVLLAVAIALLLAAAFGVAHSRVQLLPLGLALAFLAQLLRLWPP